MVVGTEPERLILVVSPVQISSEEGDMATLGVGSTVISKVVISPIHPFAFGSISMMAVIGSLVLFTGVKTGIFVILFLLFKPMAAPRKCQIEFLWVPQTV